MAHFAKGGCGNAHATEPPGPNFFITFFLYHAETYVNGRVHTNGLENFWPLLKRNLKGTYVAVEPFHLERYVNEQVFRFNNRATADNPLTDSDRSLLALSQVSNKRLPYKELTGKSGDTPVSTTPEPFWSLSSEA